MEKRAGAPARRELAYTALVVMLIGPATVLGDEATLPRVRSGSAEVTALLDFGYAQSMTFRALVDQLERSSVIVYVRFARCTGRVPACVHYLGERGGDRYLRITIDRLGGSRNRLCCLLAHELRHAVELADPRGARTHSDVARFLAEIGREWGEGFETDAAVAAGRAVERELSAASGDGRGEQP